jgi:hypothetical protein
MVGPDGSITTPQGAHFRIHENGLSPNVAFTSMWDNYPAAVSLPMHYSLKQGDTVWLLVAGSTNPMQTLLSNAEITLKYDDGSQVR